MFLLVLLFASSLLVRTNAEQVQANKLGFGYVNTGTIVTTTYAQTRTWTCQEYDYHDFRNSTSKTFSERCPVTLTSVSDYSVPFFEFTLPKNFKSIHNVTLSLRLFNGLSLVPTQKKFRVWPGSLTDIPLEYASESEYAKKMISNILNPIDQLTHDEPVFEVFPVENTLDSYGSHQITLCSAPTECESMFNATTFKDDRTFVLSFGHVSDASPWFKMNDAFLDVNGESYEDTEPPTIEFVPYTGSTHVEGKRTFFVTVMDDVHVDATMTTLHWRLAFPSIDHSTTWQDWQQVIATKIKCNSDSTECTFKAATGDLIVGDKIQYYWTAQDMVSRVAYNPTLTETQLTPTPYEIYVIDVSKAEDTSYKLDVLWTKVYESQYADTFSYYDRQMTYYSEYNEYLFQFDTSNCDNKCFVPSYEWIVQSTSVPYARLYTGGADIINVASEVLSISSNNGPGMNLIFFYDSDSKMWGFVGVGDQPEIKHRLFVGTQPDVASTSSSTKAYRFRAPEKFVGKVGKFDFGSTAPANWICATTNGAIYWFKSTSDQPGSASCTSTYFYLTRRYRWSGFALGTGYYSNSHLGGTVTYATTKVKPVPDTFPPVVVHNNPSEFVGNAVVLEFEIYDEGHPPSGIGLLPDIIPPALYWRVSGSEWSYRQLEPSKDHADCIFRECTWQYELLDLQPNDVVEYYVKAFDDDENVVTTDTSTLTVMNPERMLVVEWHNIGYSSTLRCTVQLVLYENTSVFEYRYADDCKASYDYTTVGFQNDARDKGTTIRQGPLTAFGPLYISNYQMSTQASGDGSFRTFNQGLEELKYYNEVLRGSSNGRPSGLDCDPSSSWNDNKDKCDANINLPVDFEYFGVTYKAGMYRLGISRFAAAYLTDSQDAEPAMTKAWSSGAPTLPYADSGFSRKNLMAVWWGYYSSFYFYEDSYVAYNVLPVAGCPDCGVGKVRDYKGEGCGVCVCDTDNHYADDGNGGCACDSAKGLAVDATTGLCACAEGFVTSGDGCTVSCDACLAECAGSANAAVIERVFWTKKAKVHCDDAVGTEPSEPSEPASYLGEAACTDACLASCDAAALDEAYRERKIKPSCA